MFAFLLAALVCRGDATAYAQIIKERESVLSQILADRESKRASGVVDDEAVEAAQLALYSFRRDVATSVGDKIRNQELIISIFETKLDRVSRKLRSGIAAGIDVLEARAPLLEARQVLEELRFQGEGG